MHLLLINRGTILGSSKNTTGEQPILPGLQITTDESKQKQSLLRIIGRIFPFSKIKK
jgi:hypothetical protein